MSKRDDYLAEMKVNIQKEVDEAFDRCPTDLPVQDSQEWLRDVMLDIIYKHT